MQPTFTWNYSLDTEADRLINTVSHTANRFFLKNNFLVLPYLVPGNGQTIYLPDLRFENDFYSLSAKLAPQYPITSDQKIISSVKNKLLQSGWNNPEEQIIGYQKQWQHVQDEFLEYLSFLFPNISLKEIKIIPTLYGSLSSFDKQNSKIIAIIRLDMDIGHLAAAIISGFLMDTLGKNNLDWYSNNYLTWEEKEAFVDGLFLTTKLAELFPNYRGTLNLISNHSNDKLVTDSHKYLKTLGVSTGKIFSLISNTVAIDGNITTNSLTPIETEVLKLLIANKNNVCANDLIGNSMWPNDSGDKYSLWAIAKTIQRIRGKLVVLGVSPQVIQTKRKEGYFLVD